MTSPTDPAVVAARRDPRRRRWRSSTRADVGARRSSGSPASTTTARCGARSPTYVQLDFFVDALEDRGRRGPGARRATRSSPPCSAGDPAAIGELGLERIALALTGLFEGMHAGGVRRAGPRVHGAAPRTRRSGGRCAPSSTSRCWSCIAELRRRDFTVAVVTGGGTEFVRAISHDLYGVPPEAVVGTLIEYDFDRDDRRPARAAADRPASTGGANEGAAKVTNIQTQLGRRPDPRAPATPAATARCSSGRRPATGRRLALLVDHDDDEREFSYVSTAETVRRGRADHRRRRPPRLDRRQHGATTGRPSSRR